MELPGLAGDALRDSIHHRRQRGPARSTPRTSPGARWPCSSCSSTPGSPSTCSPRWWSPSRTCRGDGAADPRRPDRRGHSDRLQPGRCRGRCRRRAGVEEVGARARRLGRLRRPRRRGRHRRRRGGGQGPLPQCWPELRLRQAVHRRRLSGRGVHRPVRQSCRRRWLSATRPTRAPMSARSPAPTCATRCSDRSTSRWPAARCC